MTDDGAGAVGRGVGRTTAGKAAIADTALADATRADAALPDTARPDTARPDAARPDAAASKATRSSASAVAEAGVPRQAAPHATEVDSTEAAGTAALVLAAAGGDSRAWDEIVHRYSGLVWAVARGFRLGPADSADVFQTVWLRLVEHLDRLREPAHLGGWLATTTRHECLRLLRARGREIPDDDLTSGSETRVLSDPWATERLTGTSAGPEAALLASEERAAVAVAFVNLSTRCQQLLGLLVADPAPAYAEVSAALGMPVGSIGPTRGRCLDHLRRLLEEGSS